MGAALADTLYGAIAGFGISLVIQLLIREEFWIRIVGGMFLVGIGVAYYRKPPRSLLAGDDDSSANSDFASAFVLNLTNPTTVLSYLAVLATLGLGRQRALWQSSLLVAGIFCGSMTWWTILVSTANRLRQSEIWFQKGLELEETGSPIEEAIDAYRKVLEFNPSAAGALVNLGTIYYRQKKFAMKL